MEKQPLKLRKCKACSKVFAQVKPLQSVCGMLCAIEIANRQKSKRDAEKKRRERVELREAKERIKSRGEFAREAQAAFNAYIRARDDAAGYGCISCGTKAPVQYAAGHYRTVGACPELRFNELNVHKQCNKNCNLEKSGNILAYRAGLIQRIGLEKVEWLEGKHEPLHYTIDDLKALKKHYTALAKELKKNER